MTNRNEVLDLITSDSIKLCLKEGLTSAITKSSTGMSNARKSKLFVFEVSRRLCKRFSREYSGNSLNLNVIRVDPSKPENESGEWVLDATITKVDADSFIEDVVLALESESSTSIVDFNQDFSKLLHFNSSLKIYLQGLRQSREFDRFIDARLDYAKSKILRFVHSNPIAKPEIYLGFWPSPNKEGASSIWDQFDSKFSGIREIRLHKYVYVEERFVDI